MKKTLTLVLFLGIVSALSGLCIGFVNGITAPIIEANMLKAEQENLELMYPAKTFNKIEYQGDDKNILGIYEVENEAYIVKAQGFGYSSTPIVALVGFDLEGKTTGVVILSNQETNGFGSRCFEEDFILNAYVGKGLNDDIDMISGATFTSEAMKNIIAISRNAILELL